MKYSLIIIILLIIQGTKPFRKFTEADRVDSGKCNVTLNVNENSPLPDSMYRKSRQIPENHRRTGLEEDYLDPNEDVWLWFIGINIYPAKLKSN